MSLTIERLHELLRYDPDTGMFKWKEGIHKKGVRRDRVAGSRWSQLGHIGIRIDGKQYLAHRLAWFVHYGIWPGIIDHIDGDPSNNRIENLREATVSENAFNSRKNIRGSAPYKGITLTKYGTWRAQICVDQKSISLGSYTTPEEAHEAYMAAARKYRGEFARAA